ncbi:B12-binding domain-containing radical SAM protein [Litoribacter ruber]|uniref:B12-binding domain-containing radical SAM protein n=1 Tax=Litoribacter ruber TaxID=702568 RepID=UPI001FEB605B|nr:radical SAM protein [Litoribacter ruber]
MANFASNYRIVQQKVLLITPPFTQLNTPYPATAYLKGFLNTIHIDSAQADLGIEVILRLFSRRGLKELFAQIPDLKIKDLSANSARIYKIRKDYIDTIAPVISFLQFKNPTLAYNICDEDFLPQASRFHQLEELDWAFGTMGIQDKARHLATLYLEDLSDFIQEVVDPNFGFSRYAERLGRSASTFDPLYEALQQQPSFIDSLIFELLEPKLKGITTVCISVPFPGNLFGALRAGQYLKQNYPHITVTMGGGYPNTELRSLKDVRLFEFVDYITLDDGERPLENLLQFLKEEISIESLKRTFYQKNGKVCYSIGKDLDVPFSRVGTPDYTGLPLQDYLSVIEIVNPMHRLWSDGRWNKLTMAHGCYWKKCSFCDVSLNYIQHYEPVTAQLICDRVEELIDQTGQTGFHFVDEAAPPALMRELAIEILRRNLKITWWTNIRFEQRFTLDLCRLLKASGCIAVSGGLEVASDRLLKLMQKGVTVEQVAKVAHNFTESGIMVHAYLMYGFPTQNDQETIDSLEMVRQLFEHNVLQSGFWHLFAMTAHSPIGLNPSKFGVARVGPDFGGFADNDLIHEDPTGAEHEWYSDGLKKALFNYMHGLCFEFDLQEWFDFEIPETTVPNDFIFNAISSNSTEKVSSNSKLIWLGNQPEIKLTGSNKGILAIENKTATLQIRFKKEFESLLIWLFENLHENKTIPWSEFDEKLESGQSPSLSKLQSSNVWSELRHMGLLVV